jgi:hypothetical protein
LISILTGESILFIHKLLWKQLKNIANQYVFVLIDYEISNGMHDIIDFNAQKIYLDMTKYIFTKYVSNIKTLKILSMEILLN